MRRNLKRLLLMTCLLETIFKPVMMAPRKEQQERRAVSTICLNQNNCPTIFGRKNKNEEKTTSECFKKITDWSPRMTAFFHFFFQGEVSFNFGLSFSFCSSFRLALLLSRLSDDSPISCPNTTRWTGVDDFFLSCSCSSSRSGGLLRGRRSHLTTCKRKNVGHLGRSMDGSGSREA